MEGRLLVEETWKFEIFAEKWRKLATANPRRNGGFGRKSRLIGVALIMKFSQKFTTNFLNRNFNFWLWTAEFQECRTGENFEEISTASLKGWSDVMLCDVMWSEVGLRRPEKALKEFKISKSLLTLPASSSTMSSTPELVRILQRCYLIFLNDSSMSSIFYSEHWFPIFHVFVFRWPF